VWVLNKLGWNILLGCHVLRVELSNVQCVQRFCFNFKMKNQLPIKFESRSNYTQIGLPPPESIMVLLQTWLLKPGYQFSEISTGNSPRLPGTNMIQRETLLLYIISYIRLRAFSWFIFWLSCLPAFLILFRLDSIVSECTLLSTSCSENRPSPTVTVYYFIVNLLVCNIMIITQQLYRKQKPSTDP